MMIGKRGKGGYCTSILKSGEERRGMEREREREREGRLTRGIDGEE